MFGRPLRPPMIPSGLKGSLGTSILQIVVRDYNGARKRFITALTTTSILTLEGSGVALMVMF